MVDVNMVSLISLKRILVGGTIRYVEPVYIIYIIFTKSLAYKGYLAICGWIPYKQNRPFVMVNRNLTR